MKRTKRILAINGALVLVLAGAGWGAYQLLWPSSESTAASGVRTTPVTKTSVIETVSAAATVQSAYTANVDFGTAGTVSEINVKVGDTVSAGQQLAKLDAAEANQQVKVAQSNVDAAEEDLDNAETATTTAPGGTTQSVTSLEAKLEQAKLSLQQAKDAQAATVLKAPGAGTVTALNGSVGQRLSGSSPGGSTQQTTTSFIVLTDLANLTVKANVAEIDVSKLKADQPATVTVNALPDTTIAAKVSSVDLTPTTTNNVVSFGAYLVLTQPQAGLRPGQSASVSITVARADDVLAVPSAAVRGSGAQSTVTVLSDGAQVSRTVEVGLRSESLVQITSGLTEGEQVVLAASSTTAPAGGGAGRLGGGGGGGGPVIQIPGGGAIPGAGR
jgi:macrolide-specific efflux system membrane fusion protein